MLAHAAFGLMNSTPFLGGEVDRRAPGRRCCAPPRWPRCSADPTAEPARRPSAPQAASRSAAESRPTTRRERCATARTTPSDAPAEIVRQEGARMIESLLVANRGEIARRIIRTARRLGRPRRSRSTRRRTPTCRSSREADEAVCVGPANPAQSYRNAEAILAAAEVDRRAGDPPRLRLPVGERRLRPCRRGQRPDLGRARRRTRSPRWATRSTPGT